MKEEERKGSSETAISATRSLFLAFLSGLLYAIVTAIVKYMTNIHPAQILLYRFCIITSMCLPQIVWRGANILGPPGCRTVIYIRSISACVATLLHFIAYRYLPLGEVAVITCSYPVFTTIAGKIFLNESFGILQAITVILLTIGMVFISGLYETLTQNSLVYTTDRIYGLVVAFCSILCITLSAILTRKVKHVHNSVLLFLSGVGAITECVIVVLSMDKFRLLYQGLQQFFVIFIGIAGYGATSIFIIACQNFDAGSVTTMRAAADIFISFLLQVTVSFDVPNNMTIIGAVLISLAIVLCGLSKEINTYLPPKCVNIF